MLTLHACLEATGTYGEGLALYLHQSGFQVSVVNPAKIKGFAQCQLMRLKNDKADSLLIARYCEVMQPRIWQPAPIHVKQLQALVRRLDDLIIALNQEKNRLSVADQVIYPSIQSMIVTLEQQIQLIQGEIKSCIKKNTTLKQQAKLLNSIPGIGPATIAQVLAFMGNLSQFNNAKQYVAFVGLNPKEYSSGSSVKARTRLSKTGSASSRRVFYMPALVAMKHNPLIKTFSQRLKKAGKKGKLVICAAMRKLVHIIYGVLKSEKFFNPSLTS